MPRKKTPPLDRLFDANKIKLSYLYKKKKNDLIRSLLKERMAKDDLRITKVADWCSMNHSSLSLFLKGSDLSEGYCRDLELFLEDDFDKIDFVTDFKKNI